jgi:hypothetical protein
LGQLQGHPTFNKFWVDLLEWLLHSQPQQSPSLNSLSSMEAEILAATSLLVEGIMVKQFL